MKREHYCWKELIKGNWETNKITEGTDTDITGIDLKIPLSLCPESCVQTWTLLVFGQQKLLASPLWNITHQINQRFIPQAKILWIQYRRRLTSPSCLLETACPVAAESDSQAQVGSPLAGRLAFLSSHSAPSLPLGGLFSQGFERFWDVTGQWLVSTKTGFSFSYSHKGVLMKNNYTDLGVEGSTSSFCDSLLFFLDRLLFCLLCLRCLSFSSNSLPLSPENTWDDLWELRDESAEWEVRFLLAWSTGIKGKKTLCVTQRRG